MVDNRFDAIVIGGGIYGLMAGLELSSRGWRSLLVEKGDWGGGTTSAWLRIVHGGLRYLQTADLFRFYESVGERSWFLRRFPEYVVPLPCIMPLYASGSRSPMVMRAALMLNDVLSPHRNQGLKETHRLKRGRLVTPEFVTEKLPYVQPQGLVGGACWYDAVAVEPERLLQELLAECRRKGVTVLGHAEAESLVVEGGAVSGVGVHITSDGQQDIFYAPTVINAAGHWAPTLAGKFGFPVERPPMSSWAWNVLFDVPCSTEFAGAVSARRPGAQTFFVLPWRGKTLIGTGHAAAGDNDDQESVPEHLVSEFVGQVSEAAPGLRLTEDRIVRILAGRLPVSSAHPIKLTSRAMIFDHGKTGARGLYSIWGIKYTTARREAEKLVDNIVGTRR